MKKYLVFFFLVMFVTQTFSQKHTLKIDSLTNKQTPYFNDFSTFIRKINIEKDLKFSPSQRKIDVNNPNFGKVDYDISNPNKSTDLPSFFIHGVSNLIARLLN